MSAFSKLRIFIYGKNAFDDIEYFNPKIDKRFFRDKKYKIHPFITIDKNTNWEYFIFQGDINNDTNETIKNYIREHDNCQNLIKLNDEIKKVLQCDDDIDEQDKKISDLKLKFIQFYDIIIISIDHLLDEDSKMAFDYFHNFTQIQSQQPFILFLTKKDNNPNIFTLYKFIKNEYFDKRTIVAYKFPTTKEEIEVINNYFIKCMNYYHQLGNDNKKSDSKMFNILICGPGGVGKSTFINQVLHEKLAKEGQGLLSTTLGLSCYYHPEYPIRIIDTNGFEGDYSVKIVINAIEKYERNFNSSNHIDLILYFSELKQRSFMNLEIELLKKLINKKKKIIFVFNDFYVHSSKEKKKIVDKYLSVLTKRLHSMKEKYKYITYNEILDKSVLISLKQHLIEDDEEEIRIKQCYGLDELFKKIYSIFMNDKILIDDIEKSTSIGELIAKVEKYDLLRNLKMKEDHYINCKIEASRLILSYSTYGIFEPFFRDSKRKELLREINKIFSLFNHKNIEDIDSLIVKIEKQIKDIKDKKVIINDFFNSIKRFKGYYETKGFNFDAYFYNETTLLFGYLYLKEFDVEYGEYIEKTKKYLKELSNSLNKAIDGFQELSKEWEDTYKSLKNHKSDREWVNRFFIVDLPNLKDK